MSASKIVCVALAALVAAGGVVGCGDSKGGTKLPSATPSATATGPVDLKASAEAFIREHDHVYDEAQRTGDYARLQSDFYAPTCKPCTENVEVLKADRDKGQHVEGYTAVRPKVIATVSGSQAVVAIEGIGRRGTSFETAMGRSSSVWNGPRPSVPPSRLPDTATAGGSSTSSAMGRSSRD